MKEKKAYIGTSGFVYKGWHEKFYPKGTKDFLAYFSTVYNSLEINSTFYRLPNETTFASWEKRTPRSFVFAVKLSRYITHIKRLKAVKRETKSFFARAKQLKKKFGVLLIQLPPSLIFEERLIEAFLKNTRALAKEYGIKRIALEPRHKTWFTEENLPLIRKIARRHKTALVFAETTKYPCYPPIEENITADFVYLRFHGPTTFASSLYGKKLLKPWAEKMAVWRKTKTVFAYFNNDIHGYAVKDAKTLMDLTET